MAGTQDNATLLQLQNEACDRMLSALLEVRRQETEVRKRVDGKKERLRRLKQSSASGQVDSFSELGQKEFQLDQLRKEIDQLIMNKRYQENRGQLYPKVEVEDIPPPIPERSARSYRTTTQHYSKPVKEVGPDQWLCLYCNTVNNEVMPLCAECSQV